MPIECNVDITYNPCGEIPLYPTVQCPVCKGYRIDVTTPLTTIRVAICTNCNRDNQIDTICQ